MSSIFVEAQTKLKVWVGLVSFSRPFCRFLACLSDGSLLLHATGTYFYLVRSNIMS